MTIIQLLLCVYIYILLIIAIANTLFLPKGTVEEGPRGSQRERQSQGPRDQKGIERQKDQDRVIGGRSRPIGGGNRRVKRTRRQARVGARNLLLQ